MSDPLQLKDILVVGRDNKSVDWNATENKINEYVKKAHADASPAGKAMTAAALSREVRSKVRNIAKKMPGGTASLVSLILKQQAKDAEEAENQAA